jgi:hypothetical protein
VPTYVKVLLAVLIAAPFVAVLEVFAGLNIYGWYRRIRVNARWYEARLQRKQKIAPRSAKIAKQLGELYVARWWKSDGAARKQIAQDAIKWLELALRLEADAHARFTIVRTIAVFALEAEEFDIAKSRAKQMVKGGKNLYDFEISNSTHHGNIILGRLAFRSGNLALAEEHLLKSADIESSPQLSSFGPTMSLAKELVEAGRPEAVSHYLRLCHKFWKHDRGAINRWLAQIARGEIPDFGKRARR